MWHMERLINTLKSVSAFTIDVVYPKRCAGCGQRGLWVCSECASNFLPFAKPWCDRCGVPHVDGSCKCGSTPISIDQVRSFGPFEGWLREAILQFKYESEWARAEHLGPMLVNAATDIRAFDTLIPVPLHPTRYRQRGFNQSQLLAQQVGKLLHRAVDDSLVRTRRTEAQARLRGIDRAANVSDAFTVRRPELVAGRAIVLIDDVITTGSTLDACARALRSAGAESVSAVTLAREM
jgi:ComF family protein